MFIGVPRDELHTGGKGKGNKEEGTTTKKSIEKQLLQIKVVKP